ncbi:MAG: CRISPR-associated protein Cas4 [Oxalobacteraceae bacterium]|nr:CRISPR-associated protein Cas4 [Oxalobacteraceae bacterium]
MQIPISALQHYAYCPRQCALIHVEQAFAENVFTLRGQAVHRQVDLPGVDSKAGVRIERALPVWSERLGLIGKCDVVEFTAGHIPYPVEYKHGTKRDKLHDNVQLAAQAMCLEEMFKLPVPAGAIFHASSKRRREVVIDAELRTMTETIIASVRTLLESGTLPPPNFDERCRHCSLIDLCQPQMLSEQQRFHALRATLFIEDT